MTRTTEVLMDQRIVEFIAGLRAAGVRVSLAESADAFRAIEQLGDLGLLRLLALRLIEPARTAVPAHGLPFESLPRTLPQ